MKKIMCFIKDVIYIYCCMSIVLSGVYIVSRIHYRLFVEESESFFVDLREIPDEEWSHIYYSFQRAVSYNDFEQLLEYTGDVFDKYVFGYDTPLTIVIKDESPKTEHGHYNFETNKIVINTIVFDTDLPMYNLWSTFLHELFHHYQYYTLTHRFKQIPTKFNQGIINHYFLWAFEWRYYIPAKISFNLYYNQVLEKNARSFSEDVLRIMQFKINGAARNTNRKDNREEDELLTSFNDLK